MASRASKGNGNAKPKTTVRISSAGIDVERTGKARGVKGLSAAPPVKRSSTGNLSLVGGKMETPPPRVNSALEAEIRRLKKEIESLTQQVGEQKATISDKDTTIADLRKRLSSEIAKGEKLQQEIDRLSTEQASALKVANDTEAKLKKTESLLKTEQDNNRTLTDTNTRLETTLAESRERTDDLLALCETQRNSLTALEAQVAEMSKKTKDEDECKTCKKIPYLEGEWHRAETELELVRARLAESESEREKDKVELKALREGARQMQRTSEKDKQAIADLKKENALQKELVEELRDYPESYNKAMGNELDVMRESYESRLAALEAKLVKQEMNYQETMRAMDETFRSERMLMKTRYERELRQLRAAADPLPG